MPRSVQKIHNPVFAMLGNQAFMNAVPNLGAALQHAAILQADMQPIAAPAPTPNIGNNQNGPDLDI